MVPLYPDHWASWGSPWNSRYWFYHTRKKHHYLGLFQDIPHAANFLRKLTFCGFRAFSFERKIKWGQAAYVLQS